jgi:hypothetical protein
MSYTVPFFPWQYWNLNSGSCVYYSGAVPLKPFPQPFLLGYFSDRVLCFLSRSALDCYPPTHVAGITDMHHYVQLIFLDSFSLTFWLGWPQIMVLLISTSWVAGITGMNHWAQPSLWHFRTCTALWLYPCSLLSFLDVSSLHPPPSPHPRPYWSFWYFQIVFLENNSSFHIGEKMWYLSLCI